MSKPWGLAGFGIIAFVSTVVALAGDSAQRVVFRYQSRPGEVVRQRIVLQTVGSARMGPSEIKTGQSTTNELKSETKKVNLDGSTEVEVTLVNVSMSITGNGRRMEFNSKTFDPAKEHDRDLRYLGRFFSTLAGKKFTMESSPEGKPTKVSGLHDIIQKAIDEVRKDFEKEKGRFFVSQILEQVASMFDDESVGRQMQSYYRMVPEKPGPVQVGETWQNRWIMDMPTLNAKCEANGEYELLGVETFRGRPCAKIRLKETLRLATEPEVTDNEKAKKPRNAGLLGSLMEQMDYTMTTSGGEGIAYWDYQSGVLVQLRQTQKMTIEARIKQGPATAITGASGLGTLTQKLNTSVRVDLIEGDEATTTGASESHPGDSADKAP
ncbi:MAG: hypothetical protein KA354_02520 [Phycisphaerae bacterium]|nr:hypothetical protein [Phycisphaerae bacterium]